MWVVVKNCDPFLGTLNIRCRIILGIQKGTLFFLLSTPKQLQGPACANGHLKSLVLCASENIKSSCPHVVHVGQNQTGIVVSSLLLSFHSCIQSLPSQDTTVPYIPKNNMEPQKEAHIVDYCPLNRGIIGFHATSWAAALKVRPGPQTWRSPPLKGCCTGQKFPQEQHPPHPKGKYRDT